MSKKRLLISTILVTMTLFSTEAYQCSSPPKAVIEIAGLCYGPYRDNENPNFHVFPTNNEMRDDIQLISTGNLTSTIRTYGVSGTLKEIPKICEEFGLDCYIGTWLSNDSGDNDREISTLVNVASANLNSVKKLIVGNEVLLRGDLTEDQLISYIQQVKQLARIPVGTADTWGIWLEHPKLATVVDVIFVHIHPYWDGIAIDEAATYVLDIWKRIRAAYPEKTVVIGETGWPSEGKSVGDAIPSEENQLEFITGFLGLANVNSVDYCYFNVFDEKWKAENGVEVEAHWGMYYSNGKIKPLLKSLVSPEAQTGIVRPPSSIFMLPFFPCGWMGDIGGITFNDASMDNPHSADTCISISYSARGSQGWAGIYWLYPDCNWGDSPDARDLTGVTKCEFWARGEKGGEMAEFKVGGVSGTYKDSIQPAVSSGVIVLSDTWKKYTIDLTNRDLSHVIGGFCWVTNTNQNPNGCTIYLDDIAYSQ